MKQGTAFMVELENENGEVKKRFSYKETQTEAVKEVMDSFFAQNKEEKVRLKRCYQVIF